MALGLIISKWKTWGFHFRTATTKDPTHSKMENVPKRDVKFNRPLTTNLVRISVKITTIEFIVQTKEAHA